ncbi:MAG: T9SS type A sorting domain-containing protein [Saprospiraceae bacterium]
MEKVISLPFVTLKNVFLLFLLISTSCVFAQNIQPEEKNTLFHHMNEVNKEWSKQNVSMDILEKDISFPSDQFRIQMHLFLVEKILRERIVTRLTSDQISNRNHFLDILKMYAASGVFPKNIYHQNRQPYFVDHLETACAVGHLIQKSGATDLVEKIKVENNFAYLAELKNDFPEINSWATENGFTTEELAWIQPGYPPVSPPYSQVGDGGGVDGKINVMKSNGDNTLLYMAGEFSEVDGVAANSIIAWDGENWQTFGEGVDGEIFDVAHGYGIDEFIICGDFILNGDTEYSNIAYWNGEEWKGLQKGDMEGVVYAIYYNGATLNVGGDFLKINEQPISYLARINDLDSLVWNNDFSKLNLSTFSYDIFPEAFSVNGPVKDFLKLDGNLLISGDFTQTAPNNTDSIINKISTSNLVYWNHYDNWVTGFNQEMDAVENLFYGSDGKLYCTGLLNGEHNMGVLKAGLWENIPFAHLDAFNENKVHGFFEMNEGIYSYGNIIPIFSMIYSQGFIGVGGSLTYGGTFDKTVRAVEVFQDEVYFAGDFTQVSNSSFFDGLVKSPFSTQSNISKEGIFVKNKIQIFNTENQLNIRYENLGKNATMNLFNMQGQILKSINLPQGSQELEVGLSSWAGGMYVYQVVNEAGKQAGKFHIN